MSLVSNAKTPAEKARPPHCPSRRLPVIGIDLGSRSLLPLAIDKMRRTASSLDSVRAGARPKG